MKINNEKELEKSFKRVETLLKKLNLTKSEEIELDNLSEEIVKYESINHKLE
jgi:hypothetical protein